MFHTRKLIMPALVALGLFAVAPLAAGLEGAFAGHGRSGGGGGGSGHGGGYTHGGMSGGFGVPGFNSTMAPAPASPGNAGCGCSDGGSPGNSGGPANPGGPGPHGNGGGDSWHGGYNGGGEGWHGKWSGGGETWHGSYNGGDEGRGRSQHQKFMVGPPAYATDGGTVAYGGGGGGYQDGHEQELLCDVNGQRIPVKSLMECQYGPGYVMNGQSYFGGHGWHSQAVYSGSYSMAGYGGTAYGYGDYGYGFRRHHHVASAMTYAYGASGTLYYGSAAAAMQAASRDRGYGLAYGDGQGGYMMGGYAMGGYAMAGDDGYAMERHRHMHWRMHHRRMMMMMPMPPAYGQVNFGWGGCGCGGY